MSSKLGTFPAQARVAGVLRFVALPSEHLFKHSYEELAASAKACRACPLWEHATQTVFGEGDLSAGHMLVGEQPGDSEDLAGHPFVGPAGKLLYACLAEAGADTRRIYITNALKHFKWAPSGGRRLHQRPNRPEIVVCRTWLELEIDLIRPQGILCLGSTAAQSVLEKVVAVTPLRGKPVDSRLAPVVMVTIHPSSILRISGRAKRHTERKRFVDELRLFLAASS